MTELTCAVWYWNYGVPKYWLCFDEQEAVLFAWNLGTGDGAIAGVEFNDGRTIAYDDWTAYKAYDQEQWQKMLQEERAKYATGTQPPSYRRVKFPFGDETVKVDFDAPGWLGTAHP